MTKLESQIAEAQSTLLSIFTSEDNQDKQKANKYIEQRNLIEAYKKELDSANLETTFSEIIESIRRMRSSYLPIEAVNQASNSTEQFSSFIPTEESGDTFNLYESYENAFMRMLGMPSSEELYISIQEDLKSIDKADGSIKKNTRGEIETILDQRQLSQFDRSVKVDLANFIKKMAGAAGDEGDDINVDQESIDPDFIESEFFKFAYLLTPPIKDGRISSCINEPSKRVAEPFTYRGQEVSGQKLKPSLLESIIRIRLGKATGIDLSGKDLSEITDIEVTGETYGVVEAIFILRVASLIRGLAKRYMKLEEDSKEAAAKLGKVPAPKSNDGGSQSDIVSVPGHKDPEKELFEAQKTIEDSILALMGDNSVPSDLQGQSQRTAGIRDGHLMGAMIGIVGVPRRRIEADLERLRTRGDDVTGSEQSATVKEISEIFGTNVGVGVVDIAAYVLALFTITEEELVGLLTQEQYDRLKETSFKNLIPNSGEKIRTNQAVDALTEKLNESYHLFVSEIMEDIETAPVIKDEE